MNELPGQPVRRLAYEFLCELPAVREACRQSRAGLAAAGLAEEELGHWELILAEAGNNAVNYALGRQKHLPIGFEFIVTAEWVEACIMDHTPGFDFPEQVELPPPDSEDGRGLYLIKTLTDHAGYFRGRGENRLLLKKKRQPLTGLHVSATAEQSETPPRVFTKIKLTFAVSGKLSRKAVEDAVSLSKNTYCSVSKMLEKSAAIDYEIVFVDGDPEP